MPQSTSGQKVQSSAVLARGGGLVVHGAGKRLKDAARVLRPVAGRVDHRDALGELPPDGSYDLLLVDYDGLSPDERGHLLEVFSGLRRTTRLLLVSEGACKRDFAQLFGQRSLTNLLARNEEVDPQELIVTAQKLLKRDIFGIEKYFAWGVDLRTLELSRSSEKDQVLREVEAYARELSVHPRLIGQYCTVTDELITNAVFNAPVDANGRPRFLHLARQTDVDLGPGEEIEIKLCSDGRRLGISVADPFGSLTQERLLEYLAKCFRKGEDQIDDKPGGAGLGFYYIFESLTQFVVNISPGRRTEMIGILDVRGSYRDFAVRNRSFNIFVAE